MPERDIQTAPLTSDQPGTVQNVNTTGVPMSAHAVNPWVYVAVALGIAGAVWYFTRRKG